MNLLAGQMHCLSATTPKEFAIYDFGFTFWHAALVLPQASGVLETLLHKLVRGIYMVRLPGIAPGHAPWRGAILLLNHNRGN